MHHKHLKHIKKVKRVNFFRGLIAGSVMAVILILILLPKKFWLSAIIASPLPPLP